MTRMPALTKRKVLVAAVISATGAVSGCVPTVGNLIVTTTVSNPACDGSGVASSAGPLSVGGTGGCISSISAALETEASQIRSSSQYRAVEVTHDVGGDTFRSNSLIAGRFEYAHALDLTGAEQIIAIHDVGFNAAHTEFTDKPITYANGKDASSIHVDSHGTATAALAAGTAAYGRTVGGAPNATLYLSSWNDGDDHTPFEDAETIEAIVVNNSWGYECLGDAYDECGINDYSLSLITSQLRNALNSYAGDEGIVVFSASNTEAQSQATFMAALPHLVPSLEEGWLAVINVARDYDPSSANLFDDSTVGLHSSGCMEAARWCVAADGTSRVANSNPNGYEYGTGTSFAAPRVSAAIAILAEAFPNLTPSEIRNRLIMTSDNTFFAADTAQIQTLNFAGGLSHDYHWEYGHGFIDLRAALLPIGATATVTAIGDVLDLSSPVVLSGGGSGDAVASALSKVTLSASDQMGGEFSFVGSEMVATASNDAKGLRALSAFTSFETESIYSFESDYVSGSSVVVPIEFSNGIHAEVLLSQNGNDASGIRIGQDYKTDRHTLSLGLSAQHDGSSLLGMSLGGSGNISSEHLGLEASYSTDLDDNLVVSLSGQSGVAHSTSNGFFDAIEDVRYSAVGASLTQSSAFTKGDQLSLFVSQPTAITSGSAQANLNLSADSGSHFAQVDIPLSPNNRETEIGFEYSIKDQSGFDWTVKASRRYNAANVSGNEIGDLALGIRRSF